MGAISGEIGTWGPTNGMMIPRFQAVNALQIVAFATDATRSYIIEYAHSTSVPVAFDPSTDLVDIMSKVGGGVFGYGVPVAPIDVEDYLGKTLPAPGHTPDWRVIPGQTTKYRPSFFERKPGIQVMTLWQVSIYTAADVLKHHAMTDYLTRDECVTVASAMLTFASVLDTMGARPSDTWSRMALGLRQLKSIAVGATKEAASLAGDALAGASDLAGKAGGKFLASFFSAAGITALAVTAGAVWLVWKGKIL